MKTEVGSFRLNKDVLYKLKKEAEGNDISDVIEKFGKHTLEEHGIEYSKEALMQFIIRQGK